MFGGYSGGAVLFLLPVVCRQGNFSARTGNKCFFLSSDEPSCHLPSAESAFRHFPSLQTTATTTVGVRFLQQPVAVCNDTLEQRPDGDAERKTRQGSGRV